MMHYYVANGQMTDRAKPKCSAKICPNTFLSQIQKWLLQPAAWRKTQLHS